MTQEQRERKLRQEIHGLRVKKFHWTLNDFKFIIKGLGYGESLRALPEDRLTELKGSSSTLVGKSFHKVSTSLQDFQSEIFKVFVAISSFQQGFNNVVQCFCFGICNMSPEPMQ